MGKEPPNEKYYESWPSKSRPEASPNCHDKDNADPQREDPPSGDVVPVSERKRNKTEGSGEQRANNEETFVAN